MVGNLFLCSNGPYTSHYTHTHVPDGTWNFGQSWTADSVFLSVRFLSRLSLATSLAGRSVTGSRRGGGEEGSSYPSSCLSLAGATSFDMSLDMSLDERRLDRDAFC